MKQKICGLLAMLLLLSGCGSSTPADTSPMSEDEITQMYSCLLYTSMQIL